MLYCRAKPRVCCLPKKCSECGSPPIFLKLLSLSNPLFLLLICFVFYSCFDFSSLHSTFLPSPVCLSVRPLVSLSLSLSLCVVSASLITFSHTLHGFSPLASLCLSASLIPICVFFSLLPQPHFLPFVPFSLFTVSFFSQLECDNFITVIQKVNDTIIVCGTNAGSPRCWMLVRVSSDITWNAFTSRCSCSLSWKHS